MTKRIAVHVDHFYYEPLTTWFEVHAYPADDGIVVYFRDVNDRIARERTQRMVMSAEREAAQRLRSLDDLKNTFLTAISHELRTPLAVVCGNADTLQRLRGHLDESTRNDLEDALAEHAARLDTLLSDLLDIDRLTRHSYERRDESVDIVDIARRVARTSGAHGRIVFDVPATFSLAADRVQIERIFTNLISNAVKYAPQGTILLRIAELSEGNVRIEVHDEGPGIPSEHLHDVFQPFLRLEPDSPTPGTGIGLALVAEFAALHDGRAWAEQRPEGGAHLFVELSPSQPPQASGPGNPQLVN